MSRTLRIGLCQMLVQADKMINLEKAKSMIHEAKAKGADVVVLPECFNCPYGTKYFATYAEPIPVDGAPSSEAITFSAMSSAAREAGVWLVAGSIPEVVQTGNQPVYYNSSMLFDRSGSLQNVHRKVHLFRINTEQVKFDEGEVLTGGNTAKAVHMKDLNCTLGVGICFDIRYPSLAAHYCSEGSELLCYPGAFNMVTGPAHWSLTAKARAVDNQQFVVLCSPARDTTADYVAYGHSLVVDPWGEVLAEAQEGEELVLATLDLDKTAVTRKRLPILSGQRTDLYSPDSWRK